MEAAIKAIGEYRASTRFMYNGPSAHIITYPVAAARLLNVLVVVSDANPWCNEQGSKHISTGTKAEAEKAFEAWHDAARAIVGLLPDTTLEKWGIFDLLDQPCPSYHMGSVCLAGDAAHACGPHLGSGAGFGIEDVLVLATILHFVSCTSEARSKLSQALDLYTRARYERTQWLIRETRAAGDMFEWKAKEGRDPNEFADKITMAFHTIWTYNVQEMVEETCRNLEAL